MFRKQAEGTQELQEHRRCILTPSCKAKMETAESLILEHNPVLHRAAFLMYQQALDRILRQCTSHLLGTDVTAEQM